MDILKKINKLRIERNWSVYRLSVESGLPQSTITNMFNRETLPSITTLEMLCQAFKISLSDFFKENADENSEAESNLLATYNSLSKEEQKLISDLIYILNSAKKTRN